MIFNVLITFQQPSLACCVFVIVFVLLRFAPGGAPPLCKNWSFAMKLMRQHAIPDGLLEARSAGRVGRRRPATGCVNCGRETKGDLVQVGGPSRW